MISDRPLTKSAHRTQTAEANQSLTMLDSGRIAGWASRTGVIDRGGDLIAPFAFRDAAAGFLKSGFVAYGHQWDRPPLGMPVEAIETAAGLFVVIELHRTPEAEAVTSTIRDRLERGLDVGLSVGFVPVASSVHGYRNGGALLVSRQGMSLPLGPDGRAAIAAWTEPCRLIGAIEALIEVSLTPVPMNSGAKLCSACQRLSDLAPTCHGSSEPLITKPLIIKPTSFSGR